MPKALVRDAGGRPWVTTAVDTLLAGGCDAVVVVLGASAREARPLVPDRPSVRTVVASAWAEGMGGVARGRARRRQGGRRGRRGGRVPRRPAGPAGRGGPACARRAG
ncbi:hypothetical protein DEJ15_15145 [Curtobacterium sp. MCJR17_043]|nr:hypothetical protein [Curtobacterium sp. MCJR17_043]WIB37078.1 hypothetical protein DEJ15_15145 [Curtobacterium sp. MCJR17_043]